MCIASLNADNANNRYRKGEIPIGEWRDAINLFDNLSKSSMFSACKRKVDDRETGMSFSEKSLQLQPDNPSYLDTYAWILFKLGDYTNALTWIEKAIAASPEVNGTMLEHQGDILFHLNRIEEAVDLWKKAAQAGETTTFIQKKIKDKKYYE